MRTLLIALFVLPQIVTAQFAPAAGKAGSSAIKHDSSCFVNWASKAEIQRGYMNIAEPDSGFAYVGDSNSALGIPLRSGVVSLGDGGSVTLSFPNPIINGQGWDFAVFENTFLDSFLELAFVEVSSNGIDFFRFPSESLTDTSVQTPAFGFTKPEHVNNLAGKYRSGYGTPFDLEELKDTNGLDVNNIQYVKIIDVVGSINNAYASRDSKGRKINDPWPTPFPSSGFDLDAVGVIHQNPSLRTEPIVQPPISIYPNPSQSNIMNINSAASQQMKVYNATGKLQFEYTLVPGNQAIVTNLDSGVYYIRLDSGKSYSYIISK